MKRLLILSGKGGTGKTTVSAAIIRLAGAKAVADCDVDAPNLHLVMRQSAEPEHHDFMGGEKAVVKPEVCIGCGKCEGVCRFEAIRIKEGKASINEYKCEGCGACEYVCPSDAVTLLPDLAGARELYKGKEVFSTATLTGLLKPGGTLTVAHGMSRKKIDGHHHGAAHHVSNGLMAAEDLASIFGRYLSVTAVVSNDSMYQVTGLLVVSR